MVDGWGLIYETMNTVLKHKVFTECLSYIKDVVMLLDIEEDCHGHMHLYTLACMHGVI